MVILSQRLFCKSSKYHLSEKLSKYCKILLEDKCLKILTNEDCPLVLRKGVFKHRVTVQSGKGN